MNVLRLHHFPICPYSRKLRLALAEKGLDAELVPHDPWRREDRLIALNPAAEVPVLEVDGLVLAESVAIAEYLEERFPTVPLGGEDAASRAEVRRLMLWFDTKFAREVTDLLWRQKLIFRLKRSGIPNTAALRAGLENVRGHLDYIGYLTHHRNWLAGDRLTLADLTAAAHLSVLDYLGDVPWEANGEAKEWYARIKSRPSFRPLLKDKIPQQPPAAHYADLDF
ncbi:MAG: glutathione S-transferase family protein [Pseudomonadota bacterium]